MHISGIRDFRDHAAEFLGGEELVFVTKHGKPASVVVPLKNTATLPWELKRELLESMGRSISDQLSRLGAEEAELLKDFEAWKKQDHGAAGR